VSRSSVARVRAISELAAFLDDEPVRALFHRMLLDPNESDDARQAAISALPAPDAGNDRDLPALAG
jgi:hypothetical protein